MFLCDFDLRHGAAEPVADLSRKLKALPGFDNVELVPNGRSTVMAYVPARTKLQEDNLKASVANKVDGWRLIEPQSYQPPTTF